MLHEKSLIEIVSTMDINLHEYTNRYQLHIYQQLLKCFIYTVTLESKVVLMREI
jgi:hypothetical protein